MVGGASSDSSRFGRYVSLKIAPELEFYVDPTARTKPSLEGASEIGMTRGLRRWLRLVESFDLIYYSSSGSLRFGRTSRLKFAAELGFDQNEKTKVLACGLEAIVLITCCECILLISNMSSLYRELQCLNPNGSIT